MATQLATRLIDAGFDVQTIQDKPTLDGLSVATIIDQVPIRFERRRYGRRVYTWVYAYVAGWFSLGDPWPCPVPRNAEISAALEHLRNNAS